MNMNLEEQIRNYTEALYAAAKPAEQLAPSHLGEGQDMNSGPVQISLEPLLRPPARRLGGPAIGLAAAIAVLLAAVPIWLLMRNEEPAVSASTQPPPTTLSVSASLFLGAWTGEDPDGSFNTLIVEDDTAIYQETGISACKAQFGQFVGGSASGPTAIDGNTLTFTGTLYCHLEEGRTLHPSFVDVEWVFDYNPMTGALTLATDPGTTLHRPGD